MVTALFKLDHSSITNCARINHSWLAPQAKLIVPLRSASAMESQPVRTPLYECHIECGGKIVDFHGFELPIWYSSIKEEHIATRSAAGIFDVSHMGFLRFVGSDVREWLSGIGTQDFRKFNKGACGYTHFLDEDGNLIDDMIFAVKSDTEILGVPNASMVSTMIGWFNEHLPDDGTVEIFDESEQTSIIAVQGPKSDKVISSVIGEQNNIGRFRCQEIAVNELGIDGWIQGTGYTGEKGVEIFIPNSQATTLWKELISKGSEMGLVPVGLGARDTLRLEKGYLLSGQDFLWPGLGISPDADLPEGFLHRNTAETAVPFGLNMDHDFIGKTKVSQSLQESSRWVGIKCVGRGPSPRPGHPVLGSDSMDSEIIGYVTSGAPSPSLGGTGIALAYMENAVVGKTVWIKSSTRRAVEAIVVRPPFL